ncbi:MAG TPA: YggT family protein [Gemmatimonadales bacterium]|nr:YggT family protein [Gemmatimonadales bacterium]
MHATFDLFVRSLVVIAVAYAAVVAATHWAVRRRRIGPFGPWPRLVRRVSDPILLPLERRVMGAGGSPQDAPLWLLGIAIAGGLVLLSFLRWVARFGYTLSSVVSAGPRAWVYFLVSGAFGLVMAAIVVRVVASWLGVSPYRRWMRPIVVLTDWIVEPVRRLLPPMGMIDFSPMVAWLILWVARGLILGLL